MAVIRWILGSLILAFNWLFTPSGVKRSADAQATIDKQTAKLALYHYRACPFCVKVRRAMKRQSLNIDSCDVKRSEAAREQLLAGGGYLKVPCLRIEDEQTGVEWIYESTDIVNYLNSRFSVEESATATASS
ncbi:MAG: glutaredoxin [Halioglobus sp.]|jgi:glutaredoxin